MTSEQNLPAVDSVWGKPSIMYAFQWRRILDVSDDRIIASRWSGHKMKYSIQEWSEFIKSGAVDITAMGEPNQDSDVNVDLLVKWIEKDPAGRLETEDERRIASAAVNMALNTNAALTELHAAITRGGLDISCCMDCGAPVVCIPDGLPMCEDCAVKNGADLATAISQQYESGRANVDLDQQFTVEWLVEIGGELAHPQEHESVVGFWSQAYREWTLRYSTIEGWTEGWTWCGKKMTQIAPAITTRRDVLKWLDVLGIEAEREWSRQHGHGG